VSDFFWGGFIRRWQKELDLPPDADPYYYYYLDWRVTTPNMDPHIRDFETINENDKEVVIKTGMFFDPLYWREYFNLPAGSFICLC